MTENAENHHKDAQCFSGPVMHEKQVPTIHKACDNTTKEFFE